MQRRATFQGSTVKRTTQSRAFLSGITCHRASLWAGLLLALCLSVAPVSSQLTEEDQEKLLEAHNSYRGMVQPSAAYMLPMRWDENLRVLAESYAVKCIWSHNPDLEELGTGENLYTTTGRLDTGRAMESWFKEHQDYSYHNNSCQEDKMCGHYTQLVWADSTAVGCAVHRCDTLEGLDGFEKAILLVCNYSPTGNYEGQQPYEEGEWCSKCPEDHQRCQNNLCMPDLEPSEEPDSEEEPDTEDEQSSIPLPGTDDPSFIPLPGTHDPSFTWYLVTFPPYTPPPSTDDPSIPPDTRDPGLDVPSPPTPTPEHVELTEEPGERPTERDFKVTISAGSVASPPAVFLTGLLVLLSLGV